MINIYTILLKVCGHLDQLLLDVPQSCLWLKCDRVFWGRCITDVEQPTLWYQFQNQTYFSCLLILVFVIDSIVMHLLLCPVCIFILLLFYNFILSSILGNFGCYKCALQLILIYLHLTITPINGSSLNFCHKVRSIQLYRMSLCAVVLQFPYTGTNGPDHVLARQC